MGMIKTLLRVSCVVAVVVGRGAYASLSPVGQQGTSGEVRRPASKADVRADAVLDPARHALGVDQSRGRLPAIDVAAVRTWANGNEDAFGFRIVLPDTFEWRTGKIVHRLRAGEFTQSVTVDAAVRDRARRNVTQAFASMSLAFLAAAPSVPAFHASYLGPQQWGIGRGEAVRFTSDGAAAVTFLFDTKTKMTLGFSTQIETALSNSERGGTTGRETKFMDYRRIGGARFPMKLEERTGSDVAVIKIKSISLNER